MRGLEELNQYYYGVDSREEAIRKIIKKIHHASYKMENYGNLVLHWTAEGLLPTDKGYWQG